MFHIEEAAGGVTLLRMDDGRVNAIGPAFVEAFPGAWEKAVGHGRPVVLAGNGKAFSAGLDLKALPAMQPQELAAFFAGFHRVVADVLAAPVPVVAAVAGPAMAGGAVLALACDLRVVEPSAKLALTEVVVGVVFPSPVLRMCRERLPASEHGPAFLQGTIRAGEACVARGWAHVAVAADARDEAVRLAAELGGNDDRAFRAAKEALNRDALADLRGFTAKEAEAYVRALASDGGVARIAAGFVRARQRAAQG